MHSRLYRFEIVGAQWNAVYEATDPLDGSTALIYEWTPPAAERDAAKRALTEVLEQLLPCEAFTADASLYLAAKSPEAAEQALATLRDHGLFTGQWHDEETALARVEAPAALVPYVPPAPTEGFVIAKIPPPPDGDKPAPGCAALGKGCAGVFLALIFALVVAGILASLSN